MHTGKGVIVQQIMLIYIGPAMFFFAKCSITELPFFLIVRPRAVQSKSCSCSVSRPVLMLCDSGHKCDGDHRACCCTASRLLYFCWQRFANRGSLSFIRETLEDAVKCELLKK